MEIKKSKRANLERFRVVLFQTGLVVSLLFTITLLSWTFKVEKFNVPDPIDTNWVVILIDPLVLEPALKKPETPKPPPVKPNPDVIKIADNTIDLPESIEPEKEQPEVNVLEKPVEKPTGESDVRISADRMPVYKNCNKIENEKARNSCTEQQLINEVYFKLKEVNIQKTEGRIIISFVVNKQGKVSDIRLLSGINDYLDAEALKAVQLLDEFEPAIHNGLPVAIQYSLPIYFKVK